MHIKFDFQSLLIISCGTGEHVVRAARERANVVALDISPKAVKNAQEMMQLHGLQADYLVADAGNTGLPNQAFDIVWGNAVLHHLEHKKCSSEIARILTFGGIAIITIPGDWRRNNTRTFNHLNYNGHYRDYGLDVFQILRNSFSDVKKCNLFNFNGEKHGINPFETAFICIK